MATLMSHGGAPETATVEQGTWKDTRQLHTYVRSYEPLALARCNVSDVVLGQQTWEQAMAAARRMPAVAATASTSARDAEVMVARVVAAAVAEAQGDALAAGGVSAVLPGDAGANGALAMAQNAQVVHELLQAREVASASAVAPEEELDDRRIVPGRGGVVEGGAVVGVDLPHGRRAELVDGPEDVEGGVVATGRVQDARGEEVVVGPTIGGNLGGRVGVHLGQVQEAPELVPRAPLDEAEAGFLARAGLGGGEVERFGHGRFDGGDAAGDG